MSKQENLPKILSYFRVIAFILFLLQAFIMLFGVENICFRFFVLILLTLFIVMSDLLDSYLYYSSLKLSQRKKKCVWTAFILEIVCWLFICCLVFNSILNFSTVEISIAISFGIIISAITSVFLTNITGSKLRNFCKIFVCIAYTAYVISLYINVGI